ncbi:MAG: rRNA ((527)-N(7))-methyltransferase [Bacteroidota bacterium]
MQIDKLVSYFPELNPNQIQQFQQLPELYRFWNEKINVISRKDIDELMEKHILHSLAIAKFIQFKPGTEILDLGTGGGFPGIPLAIFFPEVKFTLVDSIGKKIKVVEEISKELGLKNVEAYHERAEKLNIEVEFVVTRAVTRILPLYNWTRNKFNKNNFHDLNNGIIALKGGDLKEELSELKRKYREFELKNYFKEEFFETKKIIYVPMK